MEGIRKPPTSMIITTFVTLLAFGTSKGNIVQLQCVQTENIPLNDTTAVGTVIAEFDEGVQVSGTCNDLSLINNAIVLNETLRGENCGTSATTTACELTCKNGSTIGPFRVIFAIQKLDIHDPSFPSPAFHANVSEDAPTGSTVFVFGRPGIEAVDEDCWNYRGYKLEDGSPSQFIIDDATQGSVVTSGPVSYKDGSTYNLTVIATFGMPGDTSSSTTTTVLTVSVLDVDNQPPAFSFVKYTLNIHEESISADQLQTTPPMLCRDLDIGLNTTVVYRFTETNSYFHIVNDTGLLVQQKAFDRENIIDWQTNIMCYQSDDASKSDTAILHVNVSDVNDNAALFDQTELSVSVTENAAMGTYVTSVTATDKDLGDNAVIEYKLDEPNDAFRVDATSGTVSVENPDLLDRESVSNITIVAFAVDPQGNRSANNVTITIHVVDVNDNNPQFDDAVYRFYFNVSDVGHVIGAVSATDADVPETPNSNVTYAIHQGWEDGPSSGSAFPLDVDEQSGVVSVNGSVMPGSSYVMLVQACDNPVNPALRRCSTIRVISLYTSNTTFSTLVVLMDILENSKVGTMVGVLPIQGDHYLLNTDEFKVLHDVLTSNITLDRETKDVYNITVQVISDTHGPIGDVNITIQVTDMNDHPPVFDQEVYFFMLPVVLTESTVIGTVNSSDDDIGNNSARTYRLQQSSLSHIFDIDESTGSLSILDQWFTQLRSLYQLTVVVSDLGLPSLQSTTIIYVSDMMADQISLSVKLGTVASPSVISGNKTHFEREIARTLAVERVIINQTESAPDSMKTIKSYINVTGYDVNGTTIPIHLLQRLVAENWSPIQDLFREPIQYITTTDTSSDGLNTAEIALITMAGAILVGGIIAIVVIFKQYNRHMKNQRLYESLRRPSTLYDSQEVRVDFGDENGHHANREVRRYRSHEPGEMEGSFGLGGYINTGYMPDVDGNAPKSPTWSVNDTPRIPRWSTSDSLKDVIESLEELTNRLNSEDNISRITSMSKERKSIRSFKSSNDGTTPLVDDLQDKHRDLRDTDDYITPIADYPVDAEITDCIPLTEAGVTNETDDHDHAENTDSTGVFYVNSFRNQCRDRSETDGAPVILDSTAF